jgi:hypothetical protein
MRCAVIEVSGNMISDLIQQEEQTETTKSQIDSFFDLLEERALDVNPYCRSRLFQVYLRLLKFVPASISLMRKSTNQIPEETATYLRSLCA